MTAVRQEVIAGDGVDLSVAVRDGDDGAPVLLFAHGASLCGEVWAPIVERIGPRCTAVMLDLRGHGASEAPGRADDYRWQLFGADLRSVAAWCGQHFGRPLRGLVTHSFSGDCALVATADGGAFVERLLMLDPVLADPVAADQGGQRLARWTEKMAAAEAEGFASRDEAAERLEQCLRAQLAGDGLDDATKKAFARGGVVERPDGRFAFACNRDGEGHVYRNRTAIAEYLEARERIDCDVTLVFSEKRRGPQEEATAKDTDVARRVLARCRRGNFETMAGVGHFLILEAPGRVAERVAAFCGPDPTE